MKAGPWNTTLIIGNRADGKPFLTASFKDHGNTFSAKWLNENLVFVMWGRISSSDLILDVQKRAFIYKNGELWRGDVLFGIKFKPSKRERDCDR